MPTFLSEPIDPLPGTFDAAAMSRGEPGLPAGFSFRGRTLRVAECVRRWRDVRPEGGSGQMYVRRHYWVLRMEDGAEWTVYCLRQAPRRARTGEAGRDAEGAHLWFVYTIDGP